MFQVLANTRFATLFAAQVVALLGTGLLTIALALLAYDLAGNAAGSVLGTALTIKMIAYVGLAPVAQAVVARLPRKTVMIGADLIRAVVALCLPFVDAVWQIYGLIFVLQAASATFTPSFQALVPDILPDEDDYTHALSLSRMAYELENIASPVLAGFLLTLVSFHWLFLGTVAGFVGSALLVMQVPMPARDPVRTERSFTARLSQGWRIFAATPRLRGLMALNLAVAAAGAFVIVNTVVAVRGIGTDVAGAMFALGIGAICTAIIVPRVLKAVSDRTLMTAAAGGLAGTMVGMTAFLLSLSALPLELIWIIWAIIGALQAAVMTPTGRILQRSVHAEDRPAIFTAQFAASHACWLLTYPIAGWIGAVFGLAPSAAVLALLALIGAIAAPRLWPRDTRLPERHDHPDLPSDHPHLRAHDRAHAHPIIIDDIHRTWPR